MTMENDLILKNDDEGSDGMLPTTSCSLLSSSGISSLLDRVICGDNCETLAAMPAESVDLVVTSPPYDDLRTYGGHSWDFERLAGELTRVLKTGGVIVWVVADATINGSETLTSMRQAIHFKDVCGMNVHDTMIYQKRCLPLTHNRYEQEWEYMLTLSKGRPKTWNPIMVKNNNAGRKVSMRGNKSGSGQAVRDRDDKVTIKEQRQKGNVWDMTGGYSSHGERENTGNHPAPFPESLAKDHVQSWSNPGDVVLDPFAGSGTTLKAAKELGRRFVGIEINPEYVEICNRRIAQEVLNLS